MVQALQLLLVYGVTTVTLLFVASRTVRRVHPRIGLLVALLPLAFTGEALVTGGVYAPLDILFQNPPLSVLQNSLGIGAARNPILGDVVYQEMPWRHAVRDALFNGDLPLWNRFVLAGEPLLAVQQPAVLHPATWLGLLLHLPQAWTFEVMFTLLVALLSAYLLLRDWGCGEAGALLGGALWAFSDYLIFYLGYPLAPAVAPFPLLLLGLGRLARAPGRASVGITVAALVLMITSGHPETLLHAAVVAIPYYLIALEGCAERVRSILLAAVAAVLALGLTAIVLWPFWEALPYSFEYGMRIELYATSERSLPVSASLRRLVKTIVPYAHGAWGHGGEDLTYIGPAGYVGSVAIPLFLLGMARQWRRLWVLAIGGVLGLAAWSRFPLINDAICSLPLFDIALNERMVFLTSAAVALGAGLGFDALRKDRTQRGVVLAAVLTTLVILLVYLEFRGGLIRMPSGDRRLLFALQVLPLLLFVCALVYRPAPGSWRTALALSLGILAVAQRRGELHRFSPTLPARAAYPRVAILDHLPRGEPYRMVAVGTTLVPNLSAVYGLEDVRGYEAMTFAPLMKTFPLWCTQQPIWFNKVEDPTRPFLSFLNVSHVLGPPDWQAPTGWRTTAADDTGVIAENPNVLPRAFAPGTVHWEPDEAGALRRLLAIPDFRAAGVAQGTPVREATNGVARVTITRYESRRLEVTIDAQQETLVGTSITRWPGWRLRVDRRPARLLTYNVAFLGFQVPAGTHRAVLTYLPKSVILGGLTSVATLLVIVVALWWRRGRPAVLSP